MTWCNTYSASAVSGLRMLYANPRGTTMSCGPSSFVRSFVQPSFRPFVRPSVLSGNSFSLSSTVCFFDCSGWLVRSIVFCERLSVRSFIRPLIRKTHTGMTRAVSGTKEGEIDWYGLHHRTPTKSLAHCQIIVRPPPLEDGNASKKKYTREHLPVRKTQRIESV